MRSCARVRLAELGDVEQLARLAEEAAAVPSGRAKSQPDRRRRYAELLGQPDRLVLVAVDEKSGRLVGVVVATDSDVGALSPMPVMVVNHLVVEAGFRKRGVGRALLGGVVRNADDHGVDQIVVSVFTGDRNANRYLARLGFAPLAVRRIASTSALRRTLGLGDLVDRADLRRRRGMRSVLPARAVGRGA